MVEERNNDQGDLAQTEDAVTVPLTDGEKQVSIDVSIISLKLSEFSTVERSFSMWHIFHR